MAIILGLPFSWIVLLDHESSLNRCCCSVTQFCPTLCDAMDCIMPGFPALWEFAQRHNHWVYDAIQESHLLSPPSPPALNLAQCQGLFQRVSSLHQMTKVLELQHQSFQWIFRIDFLRIDWSDLLVIRGTLKSLLQHHSWKAAILRHSAFFMVQLSHPYVKNHSFDYTDLCQQSDVSGF